MSSPLSQLLRPVWGSLILAAVFQALSAVAGLVPFVAVAEIAGELLDGGAVDRNRVWNITWVAAGALAARFALMFAAGGTTHFADNNFQLHVRRRLVDRLSRVPLGWFTDKTGGHVKKAVADDVVAMHHLVGHALNDLVGAIVTPLAALGYMLWVDWRFTLVTLIPVTAGFILYSRLMSGYGERMEAYNAALAQVNTGSVEFVQGIAVVKTFGQAGRAHARFIDSANRFVDYFWAWAKGLLRVAAASDVALAPLTGLLVVSAAGTLFVAQGWIDAVDLVPFFLVGLAIAAPVLTLGHAATEMQVSSQAAARVAVMLDSPILPLSQQPRLPDGQRVEYREVSFSYDGVHEVLSEVDSCSKTCSFWACRFVRTSASAAPMLPTPKCRQQRGQRRYTAASPSCPTVTTASSESPRCCREERLNGFPLLGRCWPIRRSWFSTRPRHSPTQSRRRPSKMPFRRWWPAERCLWWLIAFGRSSEPIRLP